MIVIREENIFDLVGELDLPDPSRSLLYSFLSGGYYTNIGAISGIYKLLNFYTSGYETYPVEINFNHVKAFGANTTLAYDDDGMIYVSRNGLILEPQFKLRFSQFVVEHTPPELSMESIALITLVDTFVVELENFIFKGLVRPVQPTTCGFNFIMLDDRAIGVQRTF